MNSLRRLGLMLESQHEGPSRDEMRNMILRMAASNADRGEGAERYSLEVMMPFIASWQAMTNEKLEDMGSRPVVTVRGAVAEKLWFAKTREAYAEASKREDPFTDDCLTCWPEWLSFHAEIPRMLLSDMAWIVGHKDGNTFRAMQRWFRDHQGEGRDKDTVIHGPIRPNAE